MPSQFSQYRGGIQPIQGIQQVGSNIAKYANKGLVDAGASLSEGIQEYHKNVQRDNIANQQLETAASNVAMIYNNIKDNPDVPDNLKEMLSSQIKTLSGSRGKSTGAKLTIAADGMGALDQFTKGYQLHNMTQQAIAAQALQAQPNRETVRSLANFGNVNFDPSNIESVEKAIIGMQKAVDAGQLPESAIQETVAKFKQQVDEGLKQNPSDQRLLRARDIVANMPDMAQTTQEQRDMMKKAMPAIGDFLSNYAPQKKSNLDAVGVAKQQIQTEQSMNLTKKKELQAADRLTELSTYEKMLEEINNGTFKPRGFFSTAGMTAEMLSGYVGEDKASKMTPYNSEIPNTFRAVSSIMRGQSSERTPEAQKYLISKIEELKKQTAVQGASGETAQAPATAKPEEGARRLWVDGASPSAPAPAQAQKPAQTPISIEGNVLGYQDVERPVSVPERAQRAYDYLAQRFQSQGRQMPMAAAQYLQGQMTPNRPETYTDPNTGASFYEKKPGEWDETKASGSSTAAATAQEQLKYVQATGDLSALVMRDTPLFKADDPNIVDGSLPQFTVNGQFRGSDAKQAREALTAIQNHARGTYWVNRLIDMAREGGSSMSPEKWAEANTIIRNIQGKSRTDLIGPGQVTEAEWDIMDSIIKNPTNWFSLATSNIKGLETLKTQINANFRDEQVTTGFYATPAGSGTKKGVDARRQKAMNR